MDVSQAIKKVGLTKIARACGVVPSAVWRWKENNCLPRTDYSGETNYAEQIAGLHGGVSAADLLSKGRKRA